MVQVLLLILFLRLCVMNIASNKPTPKAAATITIPPNFRFIDCGFSVCCVGVGCTSVLFVGETVGVTVGLLGEGLGVTVGGV